MLKNNLYDKMRIILSWINPLFLMGFFVTAFVLINQPTTKGAELLFTIPLTFSLCSFLFYKIISYAADGFGLKVFYTICFFRYLVLPFLIGYNGGFIYDYYNSWQYTYAIIMCNVELIVCCFVIYRYYPKEYNSLKHVKKHKMEFYDDIGLGGMVLIFISIALISLRGTENLVKSMRFGIVSSKLDTDSLYSYDIWLAHTLLAFSVIVVTSYFQKRNDKRNSIINIVFPIVFVALSCSMIFGNNRMMIVYYALSGLCVLFKAFPKQKTIFLITIIPVFAVVIISFTMMKQYSVDVTDAATAQGVTIEDITATLSGYICGVENIARTIDMYSYTGNQMSFATIFADIADNTKFFGLPIFAFIRNTFTDIPTSVDLATTGTEMISVCGQTYFYGGPIFGWLLDIIAHVCIIRLLIHFEIQSKLSQGLARTYINTWLAVMFGMTMCYCLETLYACMTYVPFFVWISVKVNEYIRMQRRRIKQRKQNA